MDKPFSQNLDECLRYYTKSYPYANSAGAVINAGAVWQACPVNTGPIGCVPFKKVMAKVPTLTGYSPVTGAINNVRNFSTSADLAISSVTAFTGDGSFSGWNLSATPSTIYNCAYHYTADTGW